jgi:type IV pilus assembly protein PilA
MNESGSARVHDRGFALIELMVVVLVIAVLLAIAIPTFLGARRRADDASARSDLRNTIAAAIEQSNGGDFSGITPATLTTSLSGRSFTTGDSTTRSTLSISTNGVQRFGVAMLSRIGTCIAAAQSPSGLIFGTLDIDLTTEARRCTGNLAAVLLDPIGTPPAPGTTVVGPNGHGYRYIATPVNFSTAQTASSALTWSGRTGHLATITSPDELALVRQLLGTDIAFAGGSDQAVEGDWRWTAGPESGQAFWSGDRLGAPVADMFVAWGAYEPRAFPSENCLAVGWLATAPTHFNDVYCTDSYGYVVEFSP